MNRVYKIIKDIFSIIISLILIISIGYLAYKIVIFSANVLKTLFDAYPAISVAVVTGLFAFGSAIYGKVLENKHNIDNQIRSERQKIYIDFLDWIVDNVLYAEISNNKNIVGEIKDQQKKITIYASDKVLKAWSEFKYVAMNSVVNKQGLSKDAKTKYYILNEAPYIETLILAIRKELGHKNKKIKKYDILRLYINDMDDYL